LKLIADAKKKKSILNIINIKMTYLFSIKGKNPLKKSNNICPRKPEFPLSINQKELLKVMKIKTHVVLR